jgi:uncharacterized protein YndB with AHSA1/START domain
MPARSDCLPEVPAESIAAGAKLVFTRVFDAPRELVWKVWTDPKHVQQWWGPHGFTNPRCDWDARPGRPIYVDMKGPDGAIYPMTGEFREIVEPERLVFLSAVPDDKGGSLFEVRNTVTFSERDGKTTLSLTAQIVRKSPGADAYLKGMNEGWSQSLDRLASHVVTTASDREIFSTRVFDAPRELVFKVWSDSQHLANWWGPKGFSTTTSLFDFKPGGVWRFVMHGPDGRDYQNKITFVEIVEPQRIVYKHGGDRGDQDREVEPVNFQVTVTFEPEAEERTRLNMRMVFPSAAAKNFTVEKYGAIEGQRQTLERLARYVAKM